MEGVVMLSDEQSASVSRRRSGRAGAAGGIPRRPADLTELPLSFGQEQLWFQSLVAPGSPTYNVTFALRLLGRLDAAALRAALDGLTARHEVLRTRLVSVDGRPKQVVDPPAPRHWPVEDLSGLEPSRREDFVREFVRRRAAVPFGLADEPLFRALLVVVDGQEHVLLVTVHHTVFDGWSLGLLCRELAVRYEAAVTGHLPEVPELPVQFADYALWERARLAGPALAAHVAYWSGVLKDPGNLRIPTDRPRPAVQSYDGDIEVRQFGADLLAGLRALSRQQGTTLYVTLLAALQVLLHRYSGQDDILVGTVSANRSRPELVSLIGYLVNTLPIRVDLSDDPTFQELAKRVRTATLDAYAHQDLPFAKMVEALNVVRDASRSPVFQVVFSIGEEPDRELTAAGLTIRPTPVPVPVVQFDLEFTVLAVGDFTVAIAYATSLFNVATIQRMLGSLRVLMAGIVADPGRRVSELPVMSPADVHRTVVEWNDTAMDFPEVCLHELFERQATARPDAVAVIFGTERMTYAQLDARAEDAAVRLRGHGVGPEVLVGVHMRPSVDRLVSILGVLKAGGAYVALDPDHPTDRLSFMVEDAATALLLVDDPDAHVPGDTGPVHDPGVERGLRLDRDPGVRVLVPRRAFGATGPDRPPGGGTARRAEPRHAAYVLYTSGSTGRPKAVLVEHAQVANFVQGMIPMLSLGEGDRVLQFASLSFDVSVMDMFLALCSGATAVFGERDRLLSPPLLAQFMRGERITYTCMPPAMMSLLSDEDLPDLRVMLAAGEALPPQVAARWLRPGLDLYNGYGLTETAIGGVCGRLDAGNIDPMPIGSPIPNYRAYVLDAHLNPVPVGVVGELHIGGAGVARGYLNRPELTGERFIEDPFNDAPGARMYRSGDLVQWRADGNLVFLGRLDGQVKIHGQRIELGEIEATLSGHPAVLLAIVVVREDTSGDKQLVGYVRLDPHGPAPTTTDLRRHLARRLPGHMVPEHIVVLAEFPVNNSGKVDREALPAPDLDGHPDTQEPPRTLLEVVLVNTFGQVLKRDRVGAEDDFFELGGNSLQAMLLLSVLSKNLGVGVRITSVFQAPTPRQLAVLLCEEYGLTDSDVAGAAA
jgi:amino acid adenylation domain-containing protein